MLRSKRQVSSSSSFNFASLIEDELFNYGVDVAEAMDSSIREVAKESVKKLKQTSPGTKYPKGWAVRYERGRLQTGATIYGKSGTYQLAHLLEHGHAKRGGGRTAPIVHIKPVEEWATEEVHERMVQKLGG